MSTEHDQNLTGPSARQLMARHRITLWKAAAIGLYYLIAKNLPGPPTPFGSIGQWVRAVLARAIFKEMGRSVRVHQNVIFGSGVGIRIGDNSALSSNCWVASDTTIGRDVMMAPDVTILSATHGTDALDVPMRLQPVPPKRPVVIGDDVWLGTRIIILPGVRVGSHSIIGAGSVVTRDVPEYAIVAGNPARVIRDRRDNGDAGS